MLIGCICKDYTVQLEDKPFVVHNEKMVGVFQKCTAENDIYFRGVVFDDKDKLLGETALTKADFKNRVDKWVEILDFKKEEKTK